MNVTNQNPQFINSYFADLLYYHSFGKYLWDYNASDLQAFMMFRNSEYFAPSIPTMTADGSFNTPIKNVQNVQGIIATATQSGSNLILTFTDATLATFRVKQKVEDSNMFEGYVISAAPGTVTIAPLTNPTTLVAGTHFNVNTIIRATGMIAATFNSVGTTTIYEQKDVQTDWTEITRETAQIARQEKQNLYSAEAPSGEKVFYGYTQTEADTFNRFVWQCIRKYMFGNGGTNLNLLDGAASKTTGIRNRIINDSQNYVNTGAPIDQASFEAMLFQAAEVNPGFEQDLIILPGRRAARQLSTFYPAQTAFAAASKSGNDAKTVNIALQTDTISIAGLNVKIALNFGLLNSLKIPDWNKDSVYILNMSSVTMKDGVGTPRQGKMIQLIHSSNDPNSTQTVLRRETPGMTGSAMGDSTGLGMIGQNQVTTSAVDGTTIEFLDHSGIAMVAKGHGLFEYKH